MYINLVQILFSNFIFNPLKGKEKQYDPTFIQPGYIKNAKYSWKIMNLEVSK